MECPLKFSEGTREGTRNISRKPVISLQKSKEGPPQTQRRDKGGDKDSFPLSASASR